MKYRPTVNHVLLLLALWVVAIVSTCALMSCGHN